MRITRDVCAGTALAAIGFVALLQALELPIGSPERIGPGAFPIILSGLVILFGAAVAVRSILTADDARLSIGLRPLLIILAALVVTTVALPFMGIVGASLVTVAISSLALAGASPWRTAVLSFVLTSLVVIIFKIGLGLPLPLWPS